MHYYIELYNFSCKAIYNICILIITIKIHVLVGLQSRSLYAPAAGLQ